MEDILVGGTGRQWCRGGHDFVLLRAHAKAHPALLRELGEDMISVWMKARHLVDGVRVSIR